VKLFKFLAGVACGIVIGYMFSAQYATNIWWQALGMVVGGIGGYILVAPMAFFKAIPRAFMASLRGSLSAWENLKYNFKELMLIWLAVWFGSIWASLIFCGLEKYAAASDGRDVNYLSAIVAVFLFANIINLYWFLKVVTFKDGYLDDETSLFVIKHLNPVMGTFWILAGAVWYIPKVLFKYFLPWLMKLIFIRIIWELTYFISLFIRSLFRLVHSHKRALVLICATIGTGVGQYYGHLWIGLGVGLLWAAFSWHFIAIKWLKVVPNHGATSA